MFYLILQKHRSISKVHLLSHRNLISALHKRFCMYQTQTYLKFIHTFPTRVNCHIIPLILHISLVFGWINFNAHFAVVIGLPGVVGVAHCVGILAHFQVYIGVGMVVGWPGLQDYQSRLCSYVKVENLLVLKFCCPSDDAIVLQFSTVYILHICLN